MSGGTIFNDMMRGAFSGENRIKDPGSGNTIVASRSLAVCNVKTAAAEARTLARPTAPGLWMTVNLHTDGGDLTLTVTGGYDQAGSTTVTYDDAGDSATFESIDVGGTLRWQIRSSEGVSGPLQIVKQGAPGSVTDAATLTVTELTGGIITGTQSSGSTNALTLPTGTVMDAGVNMSIGDAIDVCIINLSAALADTYTLTAATGFTIVGMDVIDSAHADSEFPSSAIYRLRKTAANTFVAYRLS